MFLKASLTPIYRIKERILRAKAPLLLFRVLLKLYAIKGTVPREIAIRVNRSLSFTGRLINLIKWVLNTRSFCLLVIVRQWIGRKIATVVEIDIEVV